MTLSQRQSIGWATAALGLAGLACGIVAIAADLAFLGLIAGVLAVGAGAAGFAAATTATPVEGGADRGAVEPTRQTAAGPSAPGGVNDALTGLRSEEYFMAASEDRIEAARRYLRPVALMLLEIRAPDGRSVSTVDAGETLAETLRDADMICRRADDSFAVLLEDTPETGARLVVERLRPALRGRLGDVFVSAGVACYPAHGLDLEAIWDLAAAALATARESERDTTEVADSE